MKNQNHAFFALSADPVTYGHLWLIDKSLEMFDKLTVALAVNSDKKYTFSFDEREDMIRQSSSGRFNIVKIEPPELTVCAAKRANAKFLVRGVRSIQDFEFEMQMSYFNSSIENDITTWFIPTPFKLSQTSSSFVKKIVGFEGWEKIITTHVPPIVVEYLKEWHNKKNK